MAKMVATRSDFRLTSEAEAAAVSGGGGKKKLKKKKKVAKQAS